MKNNNSPALLSLLRKVRRWLAAARYYRGLREATPLIEEIDELLNGLEEEKV